MPRSRYGVIQGRRQIQRVGVALPLWARTSPRKRRWPRRRPIRGRARVPDVQVATVGLLSTG